MGKVVSVKAKPARTVVKALPKKQKSSGVPGKMKVGTKEVWGKCPWCLDVFGQKMGKKKMSLKEVWGKCLWWLEVLGMKMGKKSVGKKEVWGKKMGKKSDVEGQACADCHESIATVCSAEEILSHRSLVTLPVCTTHVLTLTRS